MKERIIKIKVDQPKKVTSSKAVREAKYWGDLASPLRLEISRKYKTK